MYVRSALFIWSPRIPLTLRDGCTKNAVAEAKSINRAVRNIMMKRSYRKQLKARLFLPEFRFMEVQD
jgi:hypothetical protein